jgi:bifunctional UDP-N-acetylglucosamine pyrophosphorylase/glucosamine-1-phosphate N-acetyltransferase
MGVARAQQRNVAGWVVRKRPGTAAAEAAEQALAADAHADGEEG